MKQVNFFNGRWVYEAEMSELQDNMEKSISDAIPEFWGRVIEGFNLTVTDNVVNLTKGLAVGFAGQTILLEEDFIFAIPDTDIINPSVVVGISPMKIAVGEMVDPEQKIQPVSFKDGCQVYVRLKDNDSEENTIIYPTEAEQAFNSAAPELSAEDSLRYFEAVRKTGKTYAMEQKQRTLDAVMWRELIDRNAQGVWLTKNSYVYLQDQLAFFKRKEGVEEAGAILYHFIPNDLITWVVEKIQTTTRWRLMNGQAMPVSSILKRVGQANVIDLKNRFIRSWDGTQAVGRYQADAMQKITGGFNGAYGAYDRQGYGAFAHISNQGAGGNGNGWNVFANYNFDSSRVVRTDPKKDETRPENIMLPIFILT